MFQGERMKKITLFGDVMCEPLLLKQAKQKDGQYIFDGVFENVRCLIEEADYVICNLETPLAGEEAGFTHTLFSFNTPDSFVDSIKGAGISLVTTANNHCLDRGFEGLIRTVEVLEDKNIPYFGTWKRVEDKKEAAYFMLGEQKIALISCTYGTNFALNHCKLSIGEEEHIQLLHAHNEPVYKKKGVNTKRTFLKRVWRKFLRMFSEENRTRILRTLGMTYNTPREDDYLDMVTAKPYFESLRENIRKAKQNADLVIFFPHVGGQFNINPGDFTKYTFEQSIKAGCDAIIASHPHIVQKAEMRGNVPCYYSIGNFSMSPNSVYLLNEHLPDYGLAVHLYIDNKKIQKTTFSILKIVEEKRKMLTVWPIDKYYAECNEKEQRKVEEHIKQIYQTVTGDKIAENLIRHEYTLV